MRGSSEPEAVLVARAPVTSVSNRWASGHIPPQVRSVALHTSYIFLLSRTYGKKRKKRGKQPCRSHQWITGVSDCVPHVDVRKAWGVSASSCLDSSVCDRCRQSGRAFRAWSWIRRPPWRKSQIFVGSNHSCPPQASSRSHPRKAC